jgi:hypothetical protein
MKQPTRGRTRPRIVLVLMLVMVMTGASSAPASADVPAGTATPPVAGCRAVSLTVAPGPITHTSTWLTPGDGFRVTATGTLYPYGVGPDGMVLAGTAQRAFTLQARVGYGDAWSHVGTAGPVTNTGSATLPVSFRILGTTPGSPGWFWGSFTLDYTLCESGSMPRSRWVPGRVQARHSSLCLAVRGHAHATGVTQEDCVGPELGGPNVRWTVRPTGDGVHAEIVAAHDGMCLDVAHASRAHATPVVQGTCWGGANQQWRFQEITDDPGYYLVVARHSGMCLDVAHVSTAAGGRLVQGICGAGANQRWRFTNW